MCGKFHTPCQWGELGVVYFNQQMNACAWVRMVENDQKHLKIMSFWSKNKVTKTALATKVANYFLNGFWFWLDESTNFSPFCFASPEIIGVKVCNRQTDRDKFFDTTYRCIWIFLSVKFATSI